MVAEWTSEVDALIQRSAEDAQKQAGDARYVVYAILDPTQKDPCGVYPGLPFYVGETRKISNRIVRHFVTACQVKAKHCSRIIQIRQLLSRGVVASFVILERHDTRVDVVEAETRWSQAFLANGYPLTNQCSWQCQPMPAEQMEAVIAERRWSTSLRDARAAGLRIFVKCKGVGHKRTIRPKEYRQYIEDYGKYRPIRRIRELTAQCPKCGAECGHVILRRGESLAPARAMKRRTIAEQP